MPPDSDGAIAQEQDGQDGQDGQDDNQDDSRDECRLDVNAETTFGAANMRWILK